jgi:ABC-type multidrug transport system fused ATPase/permease subunit
MSQKTDDFETQQTTDFEAAQPFIRRTTEEKPKTERSFAQDHGVQDVREVSQGLFSGEASMLLCVSEAAEFSPDWGRKKITSSGDGKRLAFPYDAARDRSTLYSSAASLRMCPERSSMPEPVIRIEHLSRSFGAVTALDDLSLEVPAGIIFGFLGPNGAGKTTTIHLLLGLLEPTVGRASVLGFDTRKLGISRVRFRRSHLLFF